MLQLLPLFLAVHHNFNMECLVYKTVKKVGVVDKKIISVVFQVLKYLKKEGNLSIHIVGNQKMRSLNRDYRGKDSVTDVLSFAAQEGGVNLLIGEELGDIFICVGQVKMQAVDNGIPYKEEFLRMLIHGVLHLLGQDHVEAGQAKKMFKIQEELLAKAL